MYTITFVTYVEMEAFNIINQKKTNFQNFINSLLDSHQTHTNEKFKEYYNKLCSASCDQFILYIMKTLIPEINNNYNGKAKLYLDHIIENEFKMKTTDFKPEEYYKFKSYLKLFIYLLT